MYDIIIVGAGPAGMSAAIYGLRAGKTVLLIEEKSYGGQIINTPEVENYPAIRKISGYEFATNLYQQVKELGAEIVYEKAKQIREENNVKLVITNKNTYQAQSVILATGAKNRPLGLENEEELIGRGISYCATCDGMFFRGKDVAVVGGGSTALEDATFLSNYCNKVYVIHRRDSFRGENRLVKNLAEKENVVFVLNSNVTEIAGKEQLTGITVKNVLDNSERKIAVSGLFVAIGQMPDNEAFQNVVNLDDKGYVIAGEDCVTATEGIYVAGDCRTKSIRQLTTATADGAVAGLKASEQ
jgi:thioredoxin reductase (NADPH)